MLRMTRRDNENITILLGDVSVVIRFVECKRGRCAIGIDAPQQVQIVRTELLPDKRTTSDAGPPPVRSNAGMDAG